MMTEKDMAAKASGKHVSPCELCPGLDGKEADADAMTENRHWVMRQDKLHFAKVAQVELP